jgi:hypothetical protein
MCGGAGGGEVVEGVGVSGGGVAGVVMVVVCGRVGCRGRGVGMDGLPAGLRVCGGGLQQRRQAMRGGGWVGAVVEMRVVGGVGLVWARGDEGVGGVGWAVVQAEARRFVARA